MAQIHATERVVTLRAYAEAWGAYTSVIIEHLLGDTVIESVTLDPDEAGQLIHQLSEAVNTLTTL